MNKEELYKKLGLDETLLSEALEWSDKNQRLLDSLTSLLMKGKARKSDKLSPVAKLAIVLNALPDVYAKYKERGIPDEIFFDTFSDIKVWCDNAYAQYGVKGLVNIYWLAKHVSLKLFKIGRLQYEFSRFVILPHAKLKNIFRCPYRIGEKCLTLHIQQGEKLLPSRCEESLRAANEFFKKYYPEYKYRCFTVITWLLNPEFENVLGSESNIVKFGKMFTLLGYVADSDMNERRVFGYKKDRKNYIADNALRKYTLDRINRGKPLYSYNGFLDKNF